MTDGFLADGTTLREVALAARSPAEIPQVGDLVDMATGDVLLVQQDVSRPGALPLLLGRVYRSSWRAGRWFGPGWASALDQRLRVTAGAVTGVFADGRMLSWPRGAGGHAAGMPVTGPRWRLEPAGHGSYLVTAPQDGLTWHFEPRPGFRWSADGTSDLPLVAVTDRAGRRIGFDYTAAGLPAQVTHSAGYRVRVVMDGSRVTALALGAAGQEVMLVRYGYNPAGDLAAVIDPAGRALHFGYDEEGRLTGWADRNGLCCRYAYDDEGRCAAVTGPGGAMSATFGYGDRVTWRTDAAGARTLCQLDESSRVTAVTDPLGNVTHAWYDEFGRLAARADPLGRLTRYEYGQRGHLTAVTRPDGSQARADYDEAGLPARLEAPDGTSWRREHDPRGCLLREVAPDGAVTCYGYDERGHLASVTGPLGAVTAVECDPAGLPVTVTTPGGGTTRFARDPSGRVTEIMGPNDAAIQLTWTAEGWLTGRLLPGGGSERLDYDAEGNLVTRLSPSGERTSYEFGPFGVVTAMTGPEGTRTEFGYDHALRLTEVTRAGLTWRYRYDPAGRLVAETDYNGATTRYSYDQAGQLTSRVNAAGQQVSCCYDDLGRLTRREADGVVTSFGYDAAGRLALARNPDAEVRLTRDPAGRVTAETCNGRAVVSEYDPAGRRSRRVTPGGATEQWEYDDAGRPVRLDAGGQVLGFGYDQAGREVRRALPGELCLAQDWDVTGQLTAQVLTAAGDGQVLARRTYRYRADGCLEGVDDLLTGPRRFTLGRGGRITAVGGPDWAERYGYDPAGNLSLARWTSPPAAIAGPWLAADVQGPRDRAGTLITSAGAVRYQHDRQGRVIRREQTQSSPAPAVWTYQWDADDRLTAVTTPGGGTWRYRYDPFGRRIAKQRLDLSGAVAGEAIFSWDGPVLAEALLTGPGLTGPWLSGPWLTGTGLTGTGLTGSGLAEAGLGCRVTWACLPGTFTPLTQAESVSPPGPPREVTAERFHAIVTDQLGTPAELVSTDGAVAGYQQHTVWGGTLWHPGGATTPLRFPGQYHDQETGLHYNQQRYYDPVTGSYLSPDPLGLAPAPNPHAYVPNPHVQCDPLGVAPGCSWPAGSPLASAGWPGSYPAAGTLPGMRAAAGHPRGTGMSGTGEDPAGTGRPVPSGRPGAIPERPEISLLPAGGSWPWPDSVRHFANDHGGPPGPGAVLPYRAQSADPSAVAVNVWLSR